MKNSKILVAAICMALALICGIMVANTRVSSGNITIDTTRMLANSPFISDNTIASNSASSYRGGAFCQLSSATMSASNDSDPLTEDYAKQYDDWFKLAEDHLVKFEFRQAIRCCEEAIKFKPKDYLARALMCLNLYEIAEQLDVKKRGEKKEKIVLYDKMIMVAREGIDHAPDKGECYFMRGLANARRSTTRGILSSLFSAKGIEEDWLKSVESKSLYISPTGEDLLASSNLALGVYYRLCPSFFLLKLIFGISGDLNKSVEYCKRAYKLDPARIEIVKEYGVSLITRGLKNEDETEIEKGKDYLRMVPTLPFHLKTDSTDVVHSKILLDNIKLCPGYSRDQQQDISEEAFRKMK